MDSNSLATFALIMALSVAGPAVADVLLIESIESAPAISTPVRGQTMGEVRAKFGDPVTEYPTVSTDAGPFQPPITRWDFDNYSVFFENDVVIRSVIHHPTNN